MKCRTLVTVLLISCVIPASLFPVAYSGPYRAYDVFMTAFMNLANDHPGMMTVENIGKTVNGADIMMFKLGNPQSPRVLFDGGLHGWESQGGELLYLYAKWLVTNGTQLANQILANTFTLLIPALNADNYNIQRQNAHGVDLNRNFAIGWGTGGSIDPNSPYYRGPSPLSEPESRSLVDVFKAYNPLSYVNLHAGGGPMLYGTYYGNATLYSSIFVALDSSSKELNVAPYPHMLIGGPGEAMSHAASLGITSFVLELGNGTIPISDVETIVFSRFLPVAVTLSSQEAGPTDEILFTDNFELGDFSRWNGMHMSSGAAANVTTTLIREGDRGALFSLNGNTQDERIDYYATLQPRSEILSGAYFLLGSSNVAIQDGFQYFFMFVSAGNAVAYAGWRRSEGILCWRLKIQDGIGWTFADSSWSPSLNHWYYVELYWREDSANGIGQLYVDGVSVCLITAKNTAAYGSVDSVHVGLASSYNGGKTALYCDYVRVSKTGDSLSPLPYDLDLNGRIDMSDVATVAYAFISQPGDPKWDPRADLKADSKIDMYDVSQVAVHFGEKYA